MTTPSALDFFPEVAATIAGGILAGISSQQWGRAFEVALQRQLRAYGRVYLPHLGRGQRRHLPDRNFTLGGVPMSAPRQTLWFFDGQTHLDWLDIAVSYPLEDIDDWMILFRPEDLSREARELLRPPLVPRLRTTLLARPWSIVDVCETNDGNLEFTDFLRIIDHFPWIKIDHRTDTGVCIIEEWSDRTRKTLLRIELDTQLQTNVSTDFPPGELPLLLDADWTAPTDPRALIAIADVLDDIYATLRRLIRHNFHVDPDRLGPLLFWRDWPDELFEFDENEDQHFLDPALQIAQELGQPAEAVSLVLERWLHRILEEPQCRLPYLGDFLITELPDLELISYDGTHEEITIPGGPLFVVVPPGESTEE